MVAGEEAARSGNLAVERLAKEVSKISLRQGTGVLLRTPVLLRN
jgi:hypothetical protein